MRLLWGHPSNDQSGWRGLYPSSGLNQKLYSEPVFLLNERVPNSKQRSLKQFGSAPKSREPNNQKPQSLVYLWGGGVFFGGPDAAYLTPSLLWLDVVLTCFDHANRHSLTTHPRQIKETRPDAMDNVHAAWLRLRLRTYNALPLIKEKNVPPPKKKNLGLRGV